MVSPNGCNCPLRHTCGYYNRPGRDNYYQSALEKEITRGGYCCFTLRTDLVVFVEIFQIPPRTHSRHTFVEESGFVTAKWHENDKNQYQTTLNSSCPPFSRINISSADKFSRHHFHIAPTFHSFHFSLRSTTSPSTPHNLRTSHVYHKNTFKHLISSFCQYFPCFFVSSRGFSSSDPCSLLKARATVNAGLMIVSRENI